MNTEKEISERKKRWNALLSGAENARNIVIVHYLPGFEASRFTTDGDYGRESDRIVRKYHIMAENVGRIHDDTVPFLDMTTGTEIFAEAFGCRVFYPGDNMPFALSMIGSVKEISTLKTPDMWNTRLAKLFETAYNLKKRTDGSAVVKLPDIQSPLDIAALIMNKEAFYTAMADDPEAIRELAYKTHMLLTQFLDEWFKEFGKEFVAHHPDYYMEYGITLSEDEIGSFGPGPFEKLVLGELNDLSERYGRIGIHCCANARHQWGNLKKVKNLCLLNLYQPEAVILEAYDFFRDTCCQMHSFYGRGGIETWRDSFRDTRVVFQLYADSPEDAAKKLALLRED